MEKKKVFFESYKRNAKLFFYIPFLIYFFLLCCRGAKNFFTFISDMSQERNEYTLAHGMDLAAVLFLPICIFCFWGLIISFFDKNTSEKKKPRKILIGASSAYFLMFVIICFPIIYSSTSFFHNFIANHYGYHLCFKERTHKFRNNGTFFLYTEDISTCKQYIMTRNAYYELFKSADRNNNPYLNFLYHHPNPKTS